jgi:hypothetical protein
VPCAEWLFCVCMLLPEGSQPGLRDHPHKMESSVLPNWEQVRFASASYLGFLSFSGSGASLPGRM